MFDVLSVSLAVVMPMAVMMGIGFFLGKTGITDRETMKHLDKISFILFMPAILFKSIYDADVVKSFDGKMMMFAIISIFIIFMVALILPNRIINDKARAASIAVSIVRPNYVLFGLTVAQTLYGDTNIGPVAVMGALAVPITSAMSVIILEKNRRNNAGLLKLFTSIVKNPLVIAGMLALLCHFLKIKLPEVMYKVLKDISGVATPLSFISLGVGLEFAAIMNNKKILSLSLIFKMLILPLIFMPICIMMGFRDVYLCALLILFAGPVAVSSYPLVVSMGGDAQLSGQLVCCSTAVSVITLFLFTFVLTTLGVL